MNKTNFRTREWWIVSLEYLPHFDPTITGQAACRVLVSGRPLLSRLYQNTASPYNGRKRLNTFLRHVTQSPLILDCVTSQKSSVRPLTKIILTVQRKRSMNEEVGECKQTTYLFRINKFLDIQEHCRAPSMDVTQLRTKQLAKQVFFSQFWNF